MKFKTHFRDTTGEFRSKPTSALKFILLSIAATGLLVGAAMLASHLLIDPSNAQPNPLSYVAPQKAFAGETDAAKIDAAKNKIVDDIAGCETKQVAEPDAALIFDSNNQASVGSLQFQIKTIIHYVSKFESREINRVEAIQIAIDHQKAHDLAYAIIFKETDGWKNWLNCGVKLNVAPKIEILNSL